MELIKDKEKLSERANEIDLQRDWKKMRKVIKNLKKYLETHPFSIAISAPQLGYPYRIFALRFGSDDIHYFINPMIKKTLTPILSRETCDSVDGEFIIPRYKEIIAIYQVPKSDIVGYPEENRFIGTAAFFFQQMNDLLNGILLDDYGLPVLQEFREASKEEQEEIIDYYLQQLRLKSEKLNKEVEEDKDLKQAKDAIDFMTAVSLGKVELGDPENKVEKK